MIKPITDEELAKLDGHNMTLPWYATLRERLRIAEMHAGSDREERQYWESRYVEVRDRLALADAIVASADRYVNTDWQEIHVLQGLIAAYRAEVKP